MRNPSSRWRAALLLVAVLATAAGAARAGGFVLGDALELRPRGPGVVELVDRGQTLATVVLALEGPAAWRRALDLPAPTAGDPAPADPEGPFAGSQQLQLRGADEGLVLGSTLRRWPYRHLDDIVFWDLRPAGLPGGGLHPAADVDGAPLRWWRGRLGPHLGDNSRLREVTLPYLQLERASGGPLYLGILRLDAVRPRAGATGQLRWSAADAADGWPLALLVARSLPHLLHDAGEALASWGGRTPAGEPRFDLPALCGACDELDLGTVELRAARRGDQIELTVEAPGADRHSAPAWSTARLGDLPLAPWLVRSAALGATWRLPADEPAALRELQQLLRGSGRLGMEFATGVPATTTALRLELDAQLREQLAPEDEPELPSHLDPDLLDSWPNPFALGTTLQVTVPGTLGEAFGPALLPEGFDAAAAPPFGDEVELRVLVYNVSGQLIRELERGPRGPGQYEVHWDGKDTTGRPVAAGAYYLNVQLDEWSVTHRVLRLKP